jgi:hypothetical protein
MPPADDERDAAGIVPGKGRPRKGPGRRALGENGWAKAFEVPSKTVTCLSETVAEP